MDTTPASGSARRDANSSCGLYSDEIFANQFAAALLMPADEVRVLSKAGVDRYTMSHYFRVSLEALGHRPC
jgi:Zn-dependent peptidase ImmA (M78 family)